jgi:hypothetical protein
MLGFSKILCPDWTVSVGRHNSFSNVSRQQETFENELLRSNNLKQKLDEAF